MNRIMILGAGNAQLDAISYCKEKGYSVLGCGNYVSETVKPFLDRYERVDITDAERITELGREYDADILYSIGSDIAMPVVAKSSRELGLNSLVDEETSETCRSKHMMRTALGDDFAGNVGCSCYRSAEDASGHGDFPAMMKPVDSQGQRGCFRVDGEEDVRQSFDSSVKHSSIGEVVLEKYIAGSEVSVNAYFVEGEMKLAAISDRISFEDYPGGIVKEHVMPSKLEAGIQEKIRDITIEAAARVGIVNGPAYLQIKMDEDGDPKIIEIAPRLDGCHLWKLISRCYGVDLIDTCFRHLGGEIPRFDDMKETDPGTEYRLEFLCLPPGSRFSVSSFDIESEGAVEEKVMYYSEGEEVRSLNGYMEKCGYIIRRM